MSKSGEAYFWIGGPGEEAFNVCLGLQVHRGRGPAHDYLHLHYRNAGVLLAMGMPMIEHTRQLAMRWTDRHSRGRNFVGHYAVPEWNVVPVSSVIEIQHAMAPGTAIVQKRHGEAHPDEAEGITVVVGGEAGTAEGDFETCLNWTTRPGQELPVLVVITNNRFGISTDLDTVHTHRPLADRAVPYGIRNETIDGNDPVATWNAIDRAMRYCRRERKPFLLEALVSRLHGHSSSSGAQRNWTDADPLAAFEQNRHPDRPGAAGGGEAGGRRRRRPHHEGGGADPRRRVRLHLRAERSGRGVPDRLHRITRGQVAHTVDPFRRRLTAEGT